MNRGWMHRRTALLVVLGISLIGGSVGSQSPSERPVSLKDACDPTTFSPGTCVWPGGVRFDDFIAALKRKKEV